MSLPSPLSAAYWSTWSPVRPSATVIESVQRDQGEEWIGSWDAVGLYEANEKQPGYQTISLHITTHRLILIPSDNHSTHTPSLQTHLSYVRNTEYYSGFMRSSPKVTLTLGNPQSRDNDPAADSAGMWTCRVCGYVNERKGLGKSGKCGLCGVPYAQAVASPSVSAMPSRAGTPNSSGFTPPLSTADDEEGEGKVACPACTFLNSALLRNCEICTTPLPRPPQFNTAREKPEKQQVVRLSFRKGGDKEAYKKLTSVLRDKAWEREGRSSAQTMSLNGERSGAGIDGILQSIDLSAKAQDSHMQTAFADLEALMLRAGEMVRLAQSLNQKLSSQQAAASSPSGSPQGQTTEEEATMIRTSLVQLGLATPALTKEMVKNEQAYHEGLAKELGGLLTGRNGERGLMVGEGGRGVVALDEVWGLWMRARGVALLSPQALIDTLPYLPNYTSPSIHSLRLPSSLMVLHTPTFSTSSILSRTLNRLEPSSPDTDPSDSSSFEKSFSLLEFASTESLPIGLAQEFVGLMESQAGLVRDDQAGQGDGGVRWYRDIISP
ncbi:ESCRT-II complex subunit VPS36 [Cryptococcus neoformans Tu259-1]|uniref:Vacuolar protein-sorting-associated protein 36 n=1 Tax=Cryptococcus neoformans Tu259-1 TaxID=1230072 RepID=A0A854QL42_CRYNE|nr:ESCRT-II complex subunit VPS36 [Cryptococcus neoformans var. grubii AD1-83a]OXG30156.1 ESCRT-II complex subunit VPS36 [Cryptococcus neoformans var. grubii Tu259-1]OXG69486.1 ESCRT-II complex subunit VPS36 [Cryptococcus neoformans var. grubii c8]OXG70278.1 ESCRT-II complex subunit VPS36 [Cryptococcus neoformans var. grubii MW-RSA1955]OXG73652.1 ESCRT-II complex subunit VPS36 [Cryptococcus neoformans var. grubii CHC193]OXH19512.1 ESCRT-II complex subunit VPS36 [Cryptococcus neoformans var. gr